MKKSKQEFRLYDYHFKLLKKNIKSKSLKFVPQLKKKYTFTLFNCLIHIIGKIDS